MDKIVSLCKRRGFIFPGSEIYGGLANSWDYGPLGVELKNNIKRLWWQKFVQERSDVVGLDAGIIMNPKTWEASGHLASFADPLVDCKKCQQRFREDELREGKYGEIDTGDGKLHCPECGGELTESRPFNLMFKTFIGPIEGEGSEVYLRPETAQGIFVDYELIKDSMRLKLPFGVAQIGKAFRNEITPGNFIFRTREFEQMELEYFVKSGEDMEQFKKWREFCLDFLLELGIDNKNIKLRDHDKKELSHYSKATTDIEYKFPWGWGELWGIANRTDFDLSAHSKVSGQKLIYKDEEGKEFTPYVIEPSLGVDRLLLAILIDAYKEVAGGRTTTTESTKEVEVMLGLDKRLAPVKVAVLPLSKKEPLTKLAQEIFQDLLKSWNCQYDEVASIGRRYRRQDEIGTPYCVTVDFDSLEDKKVTVRDRDTMEQDRVDIETLINYLKEKFIA
ncbi:glycine--tRNA ligase [Patescibacteria group bacterium]|nr:glycine--tRNA ligase [Patescibacteria group bacterium]MBU4512008.1 glycine--tRNA ligase [Patescibacteria group bacterium]MCG2692848.1 glycine--tRNA ligase [Candidatus Parcubacteria bacterium]